MLLVYFGVGSLVLASEILVRFHDTIPDATETQFASGIGHLLEAAAGIAVLTPHLRFRSQRTWIVADMTLPAHAVGAYSAGDTTLCAYAQGGARLGCVSYDSFGNGVPFFVGIVSQVPIASVIQDRGGSIEQMLSFTYSAVPEPATQSDPPVETRISSSAATRQRNGSTVEPS